MKLCRLLFCILIALISLFYFLPGYHVAKADTYSGNITIFKDLTLMELDADVNQDGLLMIIVGNSTAYMRMRTLIEVNMAGVPLGGVIDSATLWVYYWGYPDLDPVGLSVEVFGGTDLQAGWVESIATWNIAATEVYWDPPGGGNLVTTGQTCVIPAEPGWMSFNITALVSSLYEDSISNVELALVMGNESEVVDLYGVALYSSEEDPEEGFGPYAEIVISGIEAPTPSPTVPGSVTIDLTELNLTFGMWIALILSLGLSFLALKSPILWFVACFAWVSLAALINTSWIQGVSILMAVVSLGMFIMASTSKWPR
jgi:hypothetical protein